MENLCQKDKFTLVKVFMGKEPSCRLGFKDKKISNKIHSYEKLSKNFLIFYFQSDGLQLPIVNKIHHIKFTCSTSSKLMYAHPLVSCMQ